MDGILGIGGGDAGTSVPVHTRAFVPRPGQGGGPSGDPSQLVGERSRNILAAIASLANRRQMANTAVPMQIPQGGDYAASQRIGMDTANPHAWGAERFMHGIAANIQTYVA